MNKLYKTKPTRLFTFGCSFTEWHWATWANVLAYDLDCEFYNFGKRGAGNFYISNLVTQVDSVYDFNSNDLIIVSWTNIAREDRLTESQSWITPGNIYSQDYYDKEFVKKYANDMHFALRDFSLITLIDNFLSKKCQYHFLSMCDIVKRTNQWHNSENKISKIENLFNSTLKKIKPSFYNTLWNDNLDLKFQKDKKDIHPNFIDGHPTILEHYQYLKQTFDYEFKKETDKIVVETYKEWIDDIRHYFTIYPNTQSIWQLPADIQAKMNKVYIIKNSNVKSNLIIK